MLRIYNGEMFKLGEAFFAVVEGGITLAQNSHAYIVKPKYTIGNHNFQYRAGVEGFIVSVGGFLKREPITEVEFLKELSNDYDLVSKEVAKLTIENQDEIFQIPSEFKNTRNTYRDLYGYEIMQEQENKLIEQLKKENEDG